MWMTLLQILLSKFFDQVYMILAKKYKGVHLALYTLLPNSICLNSVWTAIRLCEKPATVHSLIWNAIRECFLRLFFPTSPKYEEAFGKKWSCPQTQQWDEVQHEDKNDFGLGIRSYPRVGRICCCSGKVSARRAATPTKLVQGQLHRCPGRWRQPTLLPIAMWNLFDQTQSTEDHMNNHSKAAHHQLRAQLGMCHPTIWKFISGLREGQKGWNAF